ncbi:MAG TPA: methyltransferase domain-containing protein [bacterium]|nr:methyltransferase domain-containing protein [bacterium]
MTHRFDPKNLARLDSPDRRALIPPDPALRAIGLKAGETFLDIGAGIGYFSIPAIDIVGPEGTVIAADLSPEMLAELTLRAGDRPNLTILRSEENGLPVADGTVDRALMAFVLHEIPEPAAFLAEVRRVLKPSGHIAVIEWRPVETPMGPPVGERLAEADSRRLLEAVRFAVTAEGTLNAAHYYMVAIC